MPRRSFTSATLASTVLTLFKTPSLLDDTSFQRISGAELRSLLRHSKGITDAERADLLKKPDYGIRNAIKTRPHILSELLDFIKGRRHFEVPVYAVYGNQEDVRVIQKCRNGTYTIPNLHLVDACSSPTITLADAERPGERLKVRLLGLGGDIVYEHFFNIGQGSDGVAGEEGRIWATLLQVGELLELAEKSHGDDEIRILMSHASAHKEGIVNMLARAVKVLGSVDGTPL